MSRLLGILLRLIAVAVVIVVLTVVWIIFDGLNDSGEKADVALVTGHDEGLDTGSVQPRLDRAARLYKAGEFYFIIVGGAGSRSSFDEPAAMQKYLVDHGVPPDAVIQITGEANTWDTAKELAVTMRHHRFGSVLVITDYYYMTRLKIAMRHAGGWSTSSRATSASRGCRNALPIAREVIALYVYLGKTFVVPAAEKIREEAAVGADKAKDEAEKAKEKIDQDLKSLPR
ncbi:MAG: YdcF family protein [Verrucomicrobiota bacterium]